MLKGFKEFILRGNVIDLAVAVVIGAAFTGIVNALVTGLFNPVIALLFDADSLATVGTTLREGTETSDPIVLQWGVIVSSIIQFFLVAPLSTSRSSCRSTTSRRRPSAHRPSRRRSSPLPRPSSRCSSRSAICWPAAPRRRPTTASTRASSPPTHVRERGAFGCRASAF